MAAKTIFRTALDAAQDTAVEELGVERVEIDNKYGQRHFRFVQNKSGGSLAVDVPVMYDGQHIGTDVTASAGSTTTVERSSGSFITDGVSVDDIINVQDDAGAAGAAPEGEYSFVTKVEATKLTFSPALTVAIAVDDTVNVLKKFSIKASADAAGRAEFAGVLMATLADGKFGWVQTKGIHPTTSIVAAGTALAEGAILKPGASLLLVISDTADVGEAVGVCLLAVASDQVLRKAVVMLDAS